MRTCLPSESSAKRHRQLRADRIAVGPCVRGEEEPLPLEDFVADPVDDRAVAPRASLISVLFGHHAAAGCAVLIVLTGERGGPLRALLLDF